VSSPLGFEALEALLQWRPITLPSERAWLVVGQGLGETQTLCAGLYAGKVMWRTNLPWEDRAVDCHLIEPTGMAGGGAPLSWCEQPAGAGGQAVMTADTGLEARCLLSTEATIAGPPRLPLPQASIQVHDHPSLLSELRVTGKDPIPVTPRF